MNKPSPVIKPKVVNIDLEYVPRDWQSHVHKTRKRYSVWVLHRRAGKTVALIMEAVRTALETTGHSPRVALIYPLRTQAETVAWPILEDVCRKIPDVKILKSKLEVSFPHNGAVIRCFGTHDGQYESMRGLYFDLACFDEYAQCDGRALPEVVRPALSDHAGDLIICGTPQGRDQFYDAWMDAGKHSDIWSRYMLKASESGIINDEELSDNRKMQDEDVYAREYECEFSAVAAGAFYTNQLSQLHASGRFCPVSTVENKPVGCALDVGINDATVCWYFQIIGTNINILDCHFWHDTKMQDVLRDIRATDFNLMHMGIPHDMGHRDQLTGLTKHQTFMEMMPGVQVELLPRRPLDEGIMMVRNMFSQLYFNNATCGDGVEYLSSYVRKYSRDTQMFLNTPKHDAAADYADAIRYVAQLLDILAGGDGSGNGGTIDESVMTRFQRAPRVVGMLGR